MLSTERTILAYVIQRMDMFHGSPTLEQIERHTQSDVRHVVNQLVLRKLLVRIPKAKSRSPNKYDVTAAGRLALRQEQMQTT